MRPGTDEYDDDMQSALRDRVTELLFQGRVPPLGPIDAGGTEQLLFALAHERLVIALFGSPGPRSDEIELDAEVFWTRDGGSLSFGTTCTGASEILSSHPTTSVTNAGQLLPLSYGESVVQRDGKRIVRSATICQLKDMTLHDLEVYPGVCTRPGLGGLVVMVKQPISR